jgi:hypothetical protein
MHKRWYCYLHAIYPSFWCYWVITKSLFFYSSWSKAYWQSGQKQTWQKLNPISFSEIKWELNWWTYAQKTILLPPCFIPFFLMFLNNYKNYIFLLFIIESLDWNRYDRNLVLYNFLWSNGNQTDELMHKRQYCYLHAITPYFWCFWVITKSIFFSSSSSKAWTETDMTEI